ncbi:X-Pro dipeptidyl-peptidase [Dictyobacter alpinus]|uniref:X-Pro dipeptidyl-peptidase n=1 Tax=Dictyobacter alpinus TaxID=2014873 RepID=A0A402BJH3_9CHLR|nr:CocE/NonD family hydrolase [Dictyobacter alpinus]GCE31497.1 X-Pro dipeptidyl-peptidase [Dictyobacter alpinus]
MTTDIQQADYSKEHNIMVPMRDGVRLATDVYRPKQDGQWPVLLTRVPYSKDVRVGEDRAKYLFLEMDLDLTRAIQAGYVVVIQDTRGTFASEGEFVPFRDEANDGVDTIAWIASQPWSTGQVGMFGVSYQGQTQWQAASQQPEALRAIAPCQAPESHVFPAYEKGAFQLSIVLGWTLTHDLAGNIEQLISQGQFTQEKMLEIITPIRNLDQWYQHIPLTSVPLPEEKAANYLDWLRRPPYDQYWHQMDAEQIYERIQIPMLIIAGWNDYFLNKDLAHYQAMKRHGGSELARQQTRIVIGPWSHGYFTGTFPERNYGPAASAEAVDLTGIQLRWFDRWLKGIDTQHEQEAPILLFVMGLDEWRTEAEWPLPDTHYRRFYLHSAGHANSSAGDGLLSSEQPGDEPEDNYQYDPHHPVPSKGGSIYLLGDDVPFEQSQLEERADVLCYTTPILEQAVEVTGPIELVLSVASSVPDTDFTGKLVDVYPDGRAIHLTDGILRARYREAIDKPTMMEPEQIYQLQIDLGATCNLFKADHRIRLEVSSSNFPVFDRNTNTGGDLINEHAEDFKIAANRIYHNSSHPSYLVLPLIERDKQ